MINVLSKCQLFQYFYFSSFEHVSELIPEYNIEIELGPFDNGICICGHNTLKGLMKFLGLKPMSSELDILDSNLLQTR